MPIKVKTFHARKATTLITVLEGLFSNLEYDEIHEISVKKIDNPDWPYEGVIYYKVKD